MVVLLIVAACGEGDSDGDGSGNRAPQIAAPGISSPSAALRPGESVDIRVVQAVDPDGDPLTFTWSATSGTVNPVGPTERPITRYTAPDFAGTDTVTVIVSDGRGGTATASLQFPIVVGPSATETQASAKFTTPADNSPAPVRFEVMGTSENIASGTDLWLFVQPHQTPRFYPQLAPLLVRENGNWSGVARLGDGAPGEKFDLLIVQVSRDDSRVLLATLEGGDFGGQPFLPDSSQELVRITVSLR